MCPKTCQNTKQFFPCKLQSGQQMLLKDINTLFIILHSPIHKSEVWLLCLMNRYKKSGNHVTGDFEAFYYLILSPSTNKDFQTQCVWQTVFLHTILCSEKNLGKIIHAWLSHIAEAMKREELDKIFNGPEA